jgi:hypothetical protein
MRGDDPPPTVPTKGCRPSRGTLAGVGLAVGFLICYVALARQALHGHDAYGTLRAVQTDAGEMGGRALYVDLARTAWKALRPLVPGVFEALRILSALGVALGVFFAHRTAIALRLERRTPWLALAFGCSPVAVYFGSTVEVDGLLLGTASAAWYGFVRLVRRPVPLRAAVLGLLTGFAACLHGGGQLLLAVACAYLAAWSLRKSRRRHSLQPALRAMQLAAWVIAAHVLLFALAGRWQDGYQAKATSSVLMLSQPMSRMPVTLWYEWLLPYAPFAVLWLGSFFQASTRWLAACHALCLGGYLALTNAVLSYLEPLGPDFDERGAFLVGICLPTIVLAIAWLRPRGRLLAVLVAAIVAVVQVRRADWEAMPLGFDKGLLEVAARERFQLWVGGLESDGGWVRKYACYVRSYPVPALPREIALLEQNGATVGDDLVAAWFDAQYDTLQREGRSLLMTPAALEFLRAAPDGRLRRLATHHLASRYEMERVAVEAFVGFRLRRR